MNWSCGGGLSGGDERGVCKSSFWSLRRVVGEGGSTLLGTNGNHPILGLSESKPTVPLLLSDCALLDESYIDVSRP